MDDRVRREHERQVMTDDRIIEARVRALQHATDALGGPTRAAIRLGVSRAIVTYWRNGQRRPTGAQAERIAARVPGCVAEGLR